jgi:hypothetical protein
MRRNRSEGEPGPLTLGQALAALVRLIVWCKGCAPQVKPDVAELVAQHGAGMTVIDWGRPVAVFQVRIARGGFRRHRGEAVSNLPLAQI